MASKNEFNPDWRSPPGDTIRDCLLFTKMTMEQFSEKMGQSVFDMERLLIGQLQISEDLALKLSAVLGGSVQFWLQRDEDFRKPLTNRRL